MIRINRLISIKFVLQFLVSKNHKFKYGDNRMNNLATLLKVLAAVVLATALFACGSDDDEGSASVTDTTQTGDNNTGDGSEEEGINVGFYVSIQPITSKGTAAPSNEIGIPESSSSELTVSWNEPTRTIGGDCLNESITDYKVNIGTG